MTIRISYTPDTIKKISSSNLSGRYSNDYVQIRHPRVDMGNWPSRNYACLVHLWAGWEKVLDAELVNSPPPFPLEEWFFLNFFWRVWNFQSESIQKTISSITWSHQMKTRDSKIFQKFPKKIQNILWLWKWNLKNRTQSSNSNLLESVGRWKMPWHDKSFHSW